MAEQALEIIKTTSNGKEYNNVTVKTKYKWNTTKKEFVFDKDGNKIVTKQGLYPGNHIIVEKVYAECRITEGQYGKSYAAKVILSGVTVGFYLKDYEAAQYDKLGGVGDKVKISCVLEDRLNKKVGMKVPTEVLKFEKV